MKSARLFVILVLCLSLAPFASSLSFAQSGILPSGSYIDWTHDGIPGGIPSGSWTQSGPTLSPSGSDDTSAIQAALNACGVDHFVLLGTGTFKVNSVTVPSDCVLRGLGANQTIISSQNTTAAGTIVMGAGVNNGISTAHDTSITGGLTQGSTSITVASASNIAVGDLLSISELNDPSFGVRATGSEGGCTWCDVNYGGYRTDGQTVLVTGVSGTTVTITPGLYKTYGATLPNWAASTTYFLGSAITNGGHVYVQTVNNSTSPYSCTSGSTAPSFSTSGGSAGDNTCTWLDEGTGTTTLPLASPYAPAATYAGVEDLQIYANNTGSGDAFVINRCEYCWASGIETNYVDGDVAQVFWSFGGYIQNSYFSNAMLHSPGTYDSSVDLADKTSGMIVQNNIFERLHVSVMLEWGSSGNVVGYNYSLPGFDTGSPSVVVGSIDYHGAHPMFNLEEGNVVPEIEYDSIWGSSSDATAYRNWVEGSGAVAYPIAAGRNPVTGGSTVACSSLAANETCYPFQASRAFQVSYISTADNFVGNVVGSAAQSSNIGYGSGVTPYNGGSGQTDALQWPTSRVYDTTVYGYTFGYGELSDSGTWTFDSTNAYTTAFLHGNYSNISGAIAWHSGTTHTLPASFYLTSKPVWWNSSPYPAIGPDVVGGPGPGGTAYAIPAQTCYTTVMGGSDGRGTPLTFNASTCYASPGSAQRAGTVTMFAQGAAPATTNNGPGSGAVELGVRFYSDVPGWVTGVRFYKGTSDTGTHLGRLWTDSCTQLASATFTGESPAGWQTVFFGTPVYIQQDVIYIASYYSPTGFYSDTSGSQTGTSMSSTAKQNWDAPPLHILKNGSYPYGNSPYLYQAGGGCPVPTYTGAAQNMFGDNYAVDVLFVPVTVGSGFLAPPPQPGITGVSPASGSTAGGTAVTITGQNLPPTATPQFGGANATNVMWKSGGSVQADTPSGSGNVLVAISTALYNAFGYSGSAPTVTGVSPSQGTTSGGTAITITGTGFDNNSLSVTIGSCAATSPNAGSGTSITANTGACAAGTYTVSVTDDNGTGSMSNAYTYTSGSGVQPTLTAAVTDPGAVNASGSCVNQVPDGASGMCLLTLTGSNFQSGATVTLLGSNFTGNQASCGSVTFISSTKLTCVVPTSSTAEVYDNVEVTNPGGLSSTLGSAFFYGQIVFQDGFESGNFSNWNYLRSNDSSGNSFVCVANSTGTCQAGTMYNYSGAITGVSCPNPTPIHSGSYVACQYYYLPNSGVSQDHDVYMEAHLGSGMTHFFLRNYVYFPTVASGSDSGNQRKLQYIPLNQQSGGFHWYSILNTYNKQFAMFPRGANQPICYSPTFYSNNQWYEVEQETQMNSTSPLTANGYVNLWVNGAYQTLSGSYCPTAGANMYINYTYNQPMTSFDVGEQLDNSGSAVTEYRYIDDVVLSDAYIP